MGKKMEEKGYRRRRIRLEEELFKKKEKRTNKM